MSTDDSTTDTKQKKPVSPAVKVGHLPVILDGMPKQDISILWAGNHWNGKLEELVIDDSPSDHQMSFRVTISDVCNRNHGVRVSKWLADCCFVLGMATFLLVCISLLVGR